MVSSFPYPVHPIAEAARQIYQGEEPWFYYPQLSQREWLLSATLEPYKRCNIFVGDSLLDNKYELKHIFPVRPAWKIWSDEELEKYKLP